MNTKLTRLFLLSFMLFLIVIQSARAQETFISPDAENWSCGHDSTLMTGLASDTGFMGRMSRYNYSMEHPGDVIQSGNPYIVPVVFHLLGTSTPTISYTQIKWQLARLNAAFQNQMNSFNGQPLGARAVNTQIEFRLACVAQNSLSAWTNSVEPGVMRYGGVSSTVANQITLSPSTYIPMLAITHPTAYPTTFPFANYLNIWCVPSINSGNVIGYGTFPWMNAGIDGIVMDIDVIGNNSYLTGFPLMSQLDKGAILVHEVGHYLGLYHTFENMPTLVQTQGCYGTTTGNATTSGDLLKDTPPTAIRSDLGGLPFYNSCNETNAPYGGAANENDQLENYMSYSDDDRLNTFTQDQANRMTSTFTMVTAGNRNNLNNPTNLINTGVYTNSCSIYSGLVSAMFNYSVAANSNCSTINIQFTNPTSLGFTATSWNWSFGATIASPTQSFAVTGGALTTVVTLTASNGTVSASYTRTISLNVNATIIGQSGTRVCKGSEQTIYIQFGQGVPSVVLTDGTTNTTVLNSITLSTVVTVPYTFIANSNASYSLVPASCGTVNLGSATFNVYDCCSSLITNGDFTAGNSGFNTQLCHCNLETAPGVYSGFGTYVVNQPWSVPGFFSGYFAGMPNQTGNGMMIDGFEGNNTIVITPSACGHTVTPIVWQQNVSGLEPNTDYSYSFKITEQFNSTATCAGSTNFRLLNFRTSIYNSALTALPTQTFEPIPNNYRLSSNKSPTWHLDYLVYTYTFTTPSTITSSTTFSVEINQINNFFGQNYDYLIDNIALNQITPSIQAIGNNSICPAQSTTLSAIASCGKLLTDYTYVWSPTYALTTNTVMNTTANPTTTTVYTLVATPTSTVGSPPGIVSTVTVTVRPTFTIVPTNTIVYAGNSATLTVSGSTGTYSWNPGALTGSSVVVTPSTTTIYTVTNAASGTCTANNTSTVTVSAACSQTASALFKEVNFPASTTIYTVANTVYDMEGVVTFTANTSFAGYTLRMAKGTKLVINNGVTVTFDNCRLFGCTELWYGIQVLGSTDWVSVINVTNGTTIEDMYFGIYRDASGTSGNQSVINITNSKLNKNYIGVQLLNMPSYNPTGCTYSLTVKNSTLTTASSTTSPGGSLKPSTISTYTYAYNQIAGGTSGSTASYTAFPRSHIGINLNNLSTTNNVIIGDSANTGQFNTFHNLDMGIVATNAHLRVHNNYFYYLKGSVKQSANVVPAPPTPIGPDEIGIGVVASHTVVNTYSLQVGTRMAATPTISLAYPKGNSFRANNKGISTTNCSVVIIKGNYFESDTTEEMGIAPQYPNTYYYYKGQNAIWSKGLGTRANITYNWIRNMSTAIYSSHTMSVTAGSSILMSYNTIQVPATRGYCKQAIQIEQAGGASIATASLEVRNNTINKSYSGIKASAINGGLYIHDNNSITLEGVKTLGYSTPNFGHKGIELLSCTNSIIAKNLNINSTATITSSNASNFTGVSLTTSQTNTVTCNTVNNVGRGFFFQGNCTSSNGWLGNGISNSYQGLYLHFNALLGVQGVASTSLAANTWSNVTQETYVNISPNANSLSKMYVAANGTYTTAPSLNYGTAGQTYSVVSGQGIDIQATGTPFDCTSGGCGGCKQGMMSGGGSGGDEILFSSMAMSTNSDFTIYQDETVFQNQQLVYKLQKQGKVNHSSSNPSLYNFYNANQNSNIGKFIDVQELIANNQKTLANNKNNSISPQNAVQQKTKFVNEMLLNFASNAYHRYSESELSDLVSIANECEVKGWYVVQARNIIHAFSGVVFDYENSCDDNKSVSLIAEKEETNSLVTELPKAFNLFPNPNHGKMTMLYNLGNDTNAKMDLYDVSGRLISSHELNGSVGSIEINEAQLQNGIYFYRILVSEKIVKTDKIVIIK